jgi:hypothetical protein
VNDILRPIEYYTGAEIIATCLIYICCAIGLLRP